MNTIRKNIGLAVCAFFCCVLFAGGTAAGARVVDKVLAVVNDEVVTQREFDRMFVRMKVEYEKHLEGKELEEKLEEARKGLLEQLINSKLVISLAKKEKIKINEAELDEKIKTIRSYYGSEDEFLTALSAKGTNMTEFEKEMREQMLAQEYINKEVAAQIVITPGEVQDIYEKNKDQLMSPKRVKLREIMVRRTKLDEDPQNKKKLEDIISEVKKGADFASVAAKKSEGPYADNGGDMGYVAEGQVRAEIEEAVFKLNKGQTSGIVETPIGYHVFMVEDIKEAGPYGFDEVSDFLRQQLYMKKFEEELARWVEIKRKNAYISYKNK